MKRNFSEFKKFIKDKNVAVVGIGVSNIPLIDFLFGLGDKVTAFDKKNIEKLKLDKAQILLESLVVGINSVIESYPEYVALKNGEV